MKNIMKTLTLFTAMMVCFVAFTCIAFADAPTISSINPVDVTTMAGYAPVLPATATAVYSDTTTTSVAVAWEQADSVDYETAGAFAIEGTVDGTLIKAIANVTVTNTAAVSLTGPASVGEGEAFSLTYGLTGVQDISTEDITVSYDKNLFDYVSTESIRQGAVVNYSNNDAGAGTININIDSSGEGNIISGDADILEITFNSKMTGSGNISISNASLFNSSEGKSLAESAAVSVEVTASGVDKSALSDAIASAGSVYDNAVEGYSTGQFPAGTKNALHNAIEDAETVLNNKDATENGISDAVTSLNAAVTKFNNLIITSSTGDINNSGEIELGDLGIIAGSYGIKSGDVSWNLIMQDDINGDGEIGIYDLGFIAERILSNI
jgi:hypothetical protein